MEYENNHYASKGVAGTALGIGIGALSLGALRGGLGGILGNGCAEDHTVSRYEAEQNAKIAALETEVKLRDANTFTMGEMSKFRDYVDGKIGVIEAQLCEQRVYNATLNSTVACIQGQVAQLASLTKTIIPAGSICPPVMPQYNSWTAPTATTTTA